MSADSRNSAAHVRRKRRSQFAAAQWLELSFASLIKPCSRRASGSSAPSPTDGEIQLGFQPGFDDYCRSCCKAWVSHCPLCRPICLVP